jgi:hypothetical protein
MQISWARGQCAGPHGEQRVMQLAACRPNGTAGAASDGARDDRPNPAIQRWQLRHSQPMGTHPQMPRYNAPPTDNHGRPPSCPHPDRRKSRRGSVSKCLTSPDIDVNVDRRAKTETCSSSAKNPVGWAQVLEQWPILGVRPAILVNRQVVPVRRTSHFAEVTGFGGG